jgi:hypothetical protein
MVLLSVVAVVLLGLLAPGRATPDTFAQEATPGGTTGHPFVGAWRMTNAAFPEEAPILVMLHADGTYFQVEVDGSIGIGSWEATGERSAAVTFFEQFADDRGAVNTITIRAAGVVASGGDAFTATYTIELTRPDGASGGEYGPGTVEATRIAVEPLGTPVGPLEDLFAQLGAGPPGGQSGPVAAGVEGGGPPDRCVAGSSPQEFADTPCAERQKSGQSGGVEATEIVLLQALELLITVQRRPVQNFFQTA